MVQSDVRFSHTTYRPLFFLILTDSTLHGGARVNYFFCVRRYMTGSARPALSRGEARGSIDMNLNWSRILLSTSMAVLCDGCALDRSPVTTSDGENQTRYFPQAQSESEPQIAGDGGSSDSADMNADTDASAASMPASTGEQAPAIPAPDQAVTSPTPTTPSDSSTVDEPAVDADPIAEPCADAGQDCSILACCGNGRCVGGASQVVCAEPCSENAQCNSGCCAQVSAGPRVCAPPLFCASRALASCDRLSLESVTGDFLGRATSDPNHPRSVCNPLGKLSIFALADTQQEVDNTQSPFDPTATQPPQLVCQDDGRVVATITSNLAFSDAIHPTQLCLALAALGH